MELASAPVLTFLILSVGASPKVCSEDWSHLGEAAGSGSGLSSCPHLSYIKYCLLVRVLRSVQRIGLTEAKLLGVEVASASVLTFVIFIIIFRCES